MMQPARQILATSARSMSYLYSCDASRSSAMPCAYEVIFAAYKRLTCGGDEPIASGRAEALRDRRICHRALQHFARDHPLGFQRRQQPRFDGGVHRRNRRAHVERVLAHPLAGALLLRFVEDEIDERLAGFVIDALEHLRRDLDEI